MFDNIYDQGDLEYDIDILRAKLRKVRFILNNEKIELIEEIEKNISVLKRRIKEEKIRSNAEFEEYQKRQKNRESLRGCGSYGLAWEKEMWIKNLNSLRKLTKCNVVSRGWVVKR